MWIVTKVVNPVILAVVLVSGLLWKQLGPETTAGHIAQYVVWTGLALVSLICVSLGLIDLLHREWVRAVLKLAGRTVRFFSPVIVFMGGVTFMVKFVWPTLVEMGRTGLWQEKPLLGHALMWLSIAIVVAATMAAVQWSGMLTPKRPTR